MWRRMRLFAYTLDIRASHRKSWPCVRCLSSPWLCFYISSPLQHARGSFSVILRCGLFQFGFAVVLGARSATERSARAGSGASAAGPCRPLATQFKPSDSRKFYSSTSSTSTSSSAASRNLYNSTTASSPSNAASRNSYNSTISSSSSSEVSCNLCNCTASPSSASRSNNSATSSSASRSYCDSGSAFPACTVSSSYLNSTPSCFSSCAASRSYDSRVFSSPTSAASCWHCNSLPFHSGAGLGRLHSSTTVAFLAKGVSDLLDPATDIEVARESPGAVTLVLDDGAREEEQQEVAEVFESLSFRTERNSSDVISRHVPRQNRAEGGAPRKKVDRWVNPAVRELHAAKRAQQREDAFPRGEEGGARFSASAVPLVSEAGARYQRLPINLDLQLYWARVLRQRGRQEQAVALLKQCIRDWPDDGRPYVALGTLLRKSGMVQEARKVFEDGCQAARGENPYIWQAWAVLEDRAGNTGKARKLFDAATVADQTHPAAWQGWAHLELREGNSKKARALLKKGLKYHGPNEYLLQTLALIDVRMGRFEQARSSFAKATRANPKSAASWLAWARMEASQECKTTARNLFKSGVEASPKNRYVWQAWALFEAKEGNKERARQLFQRGQQLNPVDPVIYQSYGLFEYDCGNLDAARTLFKRGVAVDPQHQPAWIAWAWVEWKEANLDVARELFQRAIAIDPKSMDAVRSFQAWGILEDREGNVGVARVLFKRALRVDSQNVPTWMSWAAMEERQGNAVRADELRNLCLQQRTEIVDENPWNLNLENMLAPAIDKLRDFLKLERRFPWSKEQGKPMDKRTVESLEALDDSSRLEEEFDVDAFLGEKFSVRYGNAAGQPRQESKVAVRRRQRLSDNEIA